ncbi:MAG: hypothetical protein GDA43_22515 [Hormoscilla sp. SP5CHS1]|nr:hypothetical protein [Hormoscilla sp. SP12CHS1]MBC6455615.1 hypothetical protein [Hormoscilla sp. SP5CHS1]
MLTTNGWNSSGKIGMPSAMLLRSAITIHIQHDITPRVQVVGNCIWIVPVGTLTDRAATAQQYRADRESIWESRDTADPFSCSIKPIQSYTP